MMQITDPIANPQLAIEKIKAEVQQQIRTGNTVKASILDVAQNGLVKLKIGQQSIIAKTDISPTVGEELLVRVVKGGNKPEFMVVRPPSNEMVQAQILRALMPKQISVQQLVDTLRSLTGQAPADTNPRQLQQPVPTQTSTSANTTAYSINDPKTAPQTAVSTTQQVNVPQPIRQLVAQMLQSTIRLDLGTGSAPATPTANNATPVVQQNTPGFIQLTTPSARADSPNAAQSVNQNLQHLANLLTVAVKAELTATTQGQQQQLEQFTRVVSEAIKNQLPGTAQQQTLNAKPAPLAAEIEKVLNQTFNDKAPITSERVRQAFNQSGLFLEANLAQGKPVTVDLKSSLLRILFQLPSLSQALQPREGQLPVPGQPTGTGQQNNVIQLLLRLINELQTQTEGALARLQINQLASVPRDETTQQVWQFELPYSHSEGSDHIGIQIQRDDPDSAQGEGDRWTVRLHFNIQPIGPVTANLSLQGETISAHFDAQQEKSAELIEQQLHLLNDALINAGLKVGKLSARQADPEQSENPYIPDFPILDEHA